MIQFQKLLSSSLRFSAGIMGSAVLAHAHPGHGLLDRGAAHIVTSPFHLFVLLMIGLALTLVANVVSAPLARRVLRVAAVALVVLTAVSWSLTR
jgi:hypothetical protein